MFKGQSFPQRNSESYSDTVQQLLNLFFRSVQPTHLSCYPWRTATQLVSRQVQTQFCSLPLVTRDQHLLLCIRKYSYRKDILDNLRKYKNIWGLELTESSLLA